jgi:hypothetical protein
MALPNSRLRARLRRAVEFGNEPPMRKTPAAKGRGDRAHSATVKMRRRRVDGHRPPLQRRKGDARHGTSPSDGGLGQAAEAVDFDEGDAGRVEWGGRGGEKGGIGAGADCK